MSVQVIRGSDQVRAALVDQMNQLRDASVGTNVHGSVSGTTVNSNPPTVTALAVTANTLSNDAARAVRATNIKKILNAHFKDTFAHKSAVSTQIATTDATDLATAITLINACRTAFTTGGHVNAANVHFNNDGTNTIAAVAATDAASFDTLAAEMTTKVNAHILLALAGQHIELVG